MAQARDPNQPTVPVPLSPPTKIKEEIWNVSAAFLQELREKEANVEVDNLASKRLYNELLHVWKTSYDCLSMKKKEVKVKGQSIIGYHISMFVKDSYMEINGFFEGYSAAYTKKEAKGKAGHHILEKIRDAGFNYRMPYRISGFPNYRGHCFISPALVPLFNEPKFIDAIYTMKEIIEAQLDELATLPWGDGSPKKKVEGKKWERIVGPFDFCKKFYSLYIEYVNCSRFGKLRYNHIPTGAEKVHKHLKDFPNRPRKPGKKPDLDLDRALIELIAELRDKKDTFYGSPGGFIWDVLMHSMQAIDEELSAHHLRNPFRALMFSKILYIYDCERGCGKEEKIRTTVNTLSFNISPYHCEEYELQEIVDEPEIFFYNFARCRNKIDGKDCLAKVNVARCYIVYCPHFLVINFLDSFNIPKNMYQVELNNFINVKRLADVHEYEKYSVSTIDIIPLELRTTDNDHDAHAIVSVKTLDEWIEINDVNVNPNTCDINRAQGQTVVLYRKKVEHHKKNYPRYDSFARS